jgi:hypothetical protein
LKIEDKYICQEDGLLRDLLLGWKDADDCGKLASAEISAEV